MRVILYNFNVKNALKQLLVIIKSYINYNDDYDGSEYSERT